MIYRLYPINDNSEIFIDFSDVFEAYQAFKTNGKLGKIYKIYPDNVQILLYF